MIARTDLKEGSMMDGSRNRDYDDFFRTSEEKDHDRTDDQVQRAQEPKVHEQPQSYERRPLPRAQLNVPWPHPQQPDEHGRDRQHHGQAHHRRQT